MRDMHRRGFGAKELDAMSGFGEDAIREMLRGGT